MRYRVIKITLILIKLFLAVENLTTKTSTSISVVSGLLYVSVYEYTKGEEHDAKAMFGGTHLVDYIVYTDKRRY